LIIENPENHFLLKDEERGEIEIELEEDKIKIELLDYFLNFLANENLNYVLAGYFSKFLNLLMNKNQKKVI
jgi:hypothetical protein